MNKTLHKQQGFTLVEMIVVIAIIAILAAVVIPATVGFIDRARLSNDQTFASQATRTLEFAIVENQDLLDEQLDAYTVKQIIHEASGEVLDWTPQSRNTGFFFLEDQMRIVVAKYEDMADPGVSLFGRNTLSAITTPGRTPEEVFGSGRHLLTTEGNTVAEIVWDLRNLPLSTDIEASYSSLVDRVENMGGLFRSNEHQERLLRMLSNYNPENTLFVSNHKWHYQSRLSMLDAWTVREILFAPGINNIPEYNGPRTIIRTNIQVPYTVRTIESNAFARFNTRSTLDISLPQSVSINAETGAFTTSQIGALGNTPNVTYNWTPPSVGIRVFRDGIVGEVSSINLSDTQSYRVDIRNIDRSDVANLRFISEQKGSTYEIRVYTNSGLAGLTALPIVSEVKVIIEGLALDGEDYTLDADAEASYKIQVGMTAQDLLSELEEKFEGNDLILKYAVTDELVNGDFIINGPIRLIIEVQTS